MAVDSKARHKTFSKKTIVAGVTAALGAGGSGLVWSAELEEVVVTARQRAESSQDIPMMVQSISGEDLQKQGITTLEDFSRFVAGVNIQTTTPGQNTIVFRGVSDGGGFLVDPTAAIYLDEQPMSASDFAPDIYPVDIARIEAVAGPQSTLFGASSQSGAIRVITNKPDPEAFSANIGVGVSTVSDGDTGYDLDGTVNIPLSDSVAIRLSGFSARDAGYIDNVLGRTIVDNTIGTGFGGGRTNDRLVSDDINEVDWQGARASIKWFVNDNWSVTAMANYQDIEAGGFNDYDPNIGDLQTVKFARESRQDEWLQTNLVIEGDLGFAKLVSATSYFDRDTMYQHDTQAYAAYFHYAFGLYGPYCCAYYDFGSDPVGYLTNDENNKSFTQEVRLSGDTDRLSWTVGGFYQDSEQFWDFWTYIDDYRNSTAFSHFESMLGIDIAPTDAWWHSFQGTDRTDYAVFGELDYEVIEDRLTLLLGGRWYEVERDLSYTVERPGGNPDRNYPDRTMKDDGFNPKYGLQLQITDDVMVYGVYSEGFRVGGVNRGRENSNGGGTLPLVYDSDTLENTEFGLKAQFADGRVLFNAVYYDMTWKDMQIEITDPSNKLSAYSVKDENGTNVYGNVPFQIVVGNVGDATIKGFDLELKALLGNNFEIGGNLTDIQDAYVEGSPFFPDERAVGGQIPSGLETQTDLPLFADQSYSLYAEYSGIDIFGGSGLVRLQHSYVGDSWNQMTNDFEADYGTPHRLRQGDYSITDLILTFQKDDWLAQLSVNNLSDERGVTYEDAADFDPLWGMRSSNVNRPRTYSLSVRKYF